MNENLKFSAPKIKTKIEDEKYIIVNPDENGGVGVVKCILTPAPLPTSAPYRRLTFMAWQSGLMKPVVPTTIDRDTNNVLAIVNLDEYKYVGVANYKPSDVNDIEKAKRIAYRKAMRNYISYYLTNYDKTWTRLYTWLESVACNAKSDWTAAGQLEQLVERYNTLDKEIKQLTET